MRKAPEITLSTDEQRERLARSNTASVREARRASIIMLAAQGKTNYEIAEALGIGRAVGASTIRRIWRCPRTQAAPLKDLQDLARSAVHRETREHRRFVAESARACAGAVL